MTKNNIISDWLDKNGDEKITEQVKMELESNNFISPLICTENLQGDDLYNYFEARRYIKLAQELLRVQRKRESFNDTGI